MTKSTVGQLEDFKKSIIWLDILEELKGWLEDVHLMLENPEGELTHMKLDRLAGSAEAFHRFSDVLDYMINNIEVKRAEEKTEDSIT